MKKIISVLFIIFGISIYSLANATSFQLKSFKDDLFKYPSIISTAWNGNYQYVDYSQKRDLEDRDIVDEKVVDPKYQSLKYFDKYRKDLSFKYNNKNISYIQTGLERSSIGVIVIYIHGMNGSRFQGANNDMFGGNFNRIQNLMLYNTGLYISPDFSDFGDNGKNQIKELIKIKKGQFKNAKIFVACGSSGGDICWRLANDKESNPLLNGLLILGSTNNYDWAKNVGTPGFHQIPVFIGHGEKDRSIGLSGQVKFFEYIKSKDNAYPIKMHVFKNGTHGTPIRMSDWREILNWMLK